MKLYVWANPYRVPFGSTMVFAVADSEESARAQAKAGAAYSYFQFPDSAPREMELGAPTRVVDLPCAEWHMVSE